MSLRPALAADVEALAGLERAAFGADAWSARAIADELSLVGASRWIQVAPDGDDTIVGYVDLMLAGETADLVRIVVAPGYRRTGMGRRLLDAAVLHATQVGCHTMLLEVAADNDAALALYADRGFAEIDRRPHYYADRVDAVVMARPLADAATTGMLREEVADG